MFTNENKVLSIYYQNTRGLRSKVGEFYHNLSCCDYDLICNSETWLDVSIYTKELFTEQNTYRAKRDFSLDGKMDGREFY